MYTLKDTERIFVFTGPDGSGRSTIADMVGRTLSMKKVISCTTRAPRPIELDGQDYHFITREQFLEGIENDEFIEHVDINNKLYGVRNNDVEHMFETFSCIYLILNPAGADILKKLYGDKVVRLFIYADRNTVTERQHKKGLDDADIEDHLSHYDNDMEYLDRCEHSFENLDLAHAVYDITNLMETYLDRNLVDKD
jgi:guanylate kinase